MWLGRESKLDEVKGFVTFQLLRGPEREDHVLYSSHTVWASHDAFVDWTKSEQFRFAHKNAGANKPMTLGHPEFEGFEVIQSLENAKATV
jgi:heme-degrading monooxygenase HmoA